MVNKATQRPDKYYWNSKTKVEPEVKMVEIRCIHLPTPRELYVELYKEWGL